MVLAEFESQEHLAQGIEKGIALIDFDAPWSDPCRAQDPIITELGESYLGKVCIATVDIDRNQAVAKRMGIQSIPTIILFKEGKEIRRFIGLQTAETLAGAIESALEM
jgi:thioredoxin 1